MDGERSHTGRRSAGRQRRRDARRLRRSAKRSRDGDPDPPLTPEEAAYAEARRAADAKLKLTGEAVRFGVFALLTLMFWRAFVWLTPFMVVLLVLWGAKLARMFYRMSVAPVLRERFVEQEVRKRVHATIHEERRQMEGQHARSLEELSASIAHEIRNPITAAKSLVQQMGEDPAAKENVEYADVALEELSRVERSVSHLLRFARDEDVAMVGMRISEVVDSALDSFHDRLEREGVALERHSDSDGPMLGDPEKLRRVVINLVGNALDALVESGTPEPRIRVETGQNLAGSHVWLRVRDNGPGVDEETRRRIFDPFYTSKQGGTGLGLALTRKVIESHGGQIELESGEDSGADFLVVLPKDPRRGGGAT